MKKQMLTFAIAISLLPLACAKKPKPIGTSSHEVAEVSRYLGYIHGADTAEGLEHK